MILSVQYLIFVVIYIVRNQCTDFCVDVYHWPEGFTKVKAIVSYQLFVCPTPPFYYYIYYSIYNCSKFYYLFTNVVNLQILVRQLCLLNCQLSLMDYSNVVLKTLALLNFNILKDWSVGSVVHECPFCMIKTNIFMDVVFLVGMPIILEMLDKQEDGVNVMYDNGLKALFPGSTLNICLQFKFNNRMFQRMSTYSSCRRNVLNVVAELPYNNRYLTHHQICRYAP